MLGAAWYGQGLRLLDISDADEVSQVGYYRVTRHGARTTRRRTRGTSLSAPSGKKGKKSGSDLVYLFDMSRGVEVLRLKQGARDGAADEVGHRAETRAARGTPPRPVSSLVDTGDPNRFVCPLFE